MSARKIIDSPAVIDYELPAALKNIFKEFDELQNYMTGVCGKPALKFVRLKKCHYSDLDELIRSKSDKRHNINTVTYHGLRIISASEVVPA